VKTVDDPVDASATAEDLVALLIGLLPQTP
jgi:hypothetical protein